MKRTLSTVRESSPFAVPPRVLVVAADDTAGRAVALAEALDAAGAEAEVRFADDAPHARAQPDAVVVAGARGYHVTRHHPILEGLLLRLGV